jgi:signal peptidase I
VAVLALAAVLGVGIATAADDASVRPMRVASNSMAPKIRAGDWIVIRDGGGAAAGRGDIVVFRFPLGTAGRAVKRVVAVEGDDVRIDRRSVTVDGRRIAIAGAPSPGAAARRVDRVPPGHVFILGDNARTSIDSRSMGAVPRSEIVARVVFVLPRKLVLWSAAIVGAVASSAVVLLVARRRRG